MSNTSLIYFDIFSLLALLFVALGGGYLPLYFYNRGKREQGQERSLTFQLGCMLSAGVMLSAGLCHLLSESIEEISERMEEFPMGTFLAGCGFIITLLADQIAKSVISSKLLSAKTEENEQDANLISKQETRPNVSGCTDEEAAALSMPDNKMTFFTACFLGFALSVHSILEGLALGAQQTLANSKDIFIAIVAHKGLAAYALGATLVDSAASNGRFWSVISVFSFASPIGVVIGMILSEYGDNFVAACLSAAAAGTFLYVALMEVLPREIANRDNMYLKLLFLLIGYGLMSLLAIWA